MSSGGFLLIAVFVFGFGIQLWFYCVRDTAVGYVAGCFPLLVALFTFDFGWRVPVIGIPTYWAYGLLWQLIGDPSNSRWSARHFESSWRGGARYTTFWLAFFRLPLIPVVS